MTMRELYLRGILPCLTFRRLLNAGQVLLSYGLSRLTGRPIVWGFPMILTVEPTNWCNFRCPQCYVGMGRMSRSRGYLKLEILHRLLNELKHSLIYLLISAQGEPYLHPSLFELIRYAKRNRVYVAVNTNGHFLADPKIARETVYSGLDVLIVSVDGAREKTYQRYRVGGKLSRVLEGIRQVLQERKEMGCQTPQVYLQFLVMRHNEKEIPEMRRLVQKLGADKLLLKTVQLEDMSQAEEFLPTNPAWRRYVSVEGQYRLKGRITNTCKRLWTSGMINWDGSLSPCCFDKDEHYVLGHLINEESFRDLWHGQAYQKFRRQILRNRRQISMCTNCTEGVRLYL